MAVTYLKKYNHPEVFVHVNANAEIIAMGNGTVSNLCTSESEEVYSYKIDSVEYGVGSGGHIVIQTGNATVKAIDLALVGSNKIENRKITSVTDANLTSIFVTFVGSANGYAVLGIKKNS